MRAFLFDLDGVLVETRELVIAGWQRVAARRGRSFTNEEIVERMFGRRTYDVLIEVFDVSQEEAAALVAAGAADKSAEVTAGPPLREIPGAGAFARAALREGIPCAVASSASAVNIGLALDAIGLAGAFDVIVDKSQVRRGKPAPDPYLAAARDSAATRATASCSRTPPPGSRLGWRLAPNASASPRSGDRTCSPAPTW